MACLVRKDLCGGKWWWDAYLILTSSQCPFPLIQAGMATLLNAQESWHA